MNSIEVICFSCMESWVDLTIDLPSDTGEDAGTSDTFPSLGHLVSLYIRIILMMRK